MNEQVPGRRNNRLLSRSLIEGMGECTLTGNDLKRWISTKRENQQASVTPQGAGHLVRNQSVGSWGRCVRTRVSLLVKARSAHFAGPKKQHHSTISVEANLKMTRNISHENYCILSCNGNWYTSGFHKHWPQTIIFKSRPVNSRHSVHPRKFDMCKLQLNTHNLTVKRIIWWARQKRPYEKLQRRKYTGDAQSIFYGISFAS